MGNGRWGRMPLTPAKLVGIGEIWDVTNNVCLSNQSEFSYTRSINSLKVPSGDTFGEGSIPTLMTHKGHFGFRDLTAQIMAVAIAGTSATGTITAIVKEKVTCAGTSVTLAQQPLCVGGATMAPITIVDANGRTFKQLSTGTPVTGEFVDTKAAKALTIAAADGTASLVIYVTYYYTGAGGKTVSAAPGTMPTGACFMFCGKMYSTRIGAFTGDLVTVMKKSLQSGDAAFGAAVGDAGSFGFDFDITVDVATDLQFCFPAE
jgi:hypothetical protein